MRALGIKRCAVVVDKSTSLIRKWSDPDHCTLQSLRHAIALDLEYARELHGTPPIFHVYSRSIRKELEAVPDGENILSAFLSLPESVCELGKKIAVEPDHPKEKTSKYSGNKQEMFSDIDLIQRKTHNLEIAINVLQSALN